MRSTIRKLSPQCGHDSQVLPLLLANAFISATREGVMSCWRNRTGSTGASLRFRRPWPSWLDAPSPSQKDAAAGTRHHLRRRRRPIGAPTDLTGSISANHGHSAVITSAEFTAGSAIALDIRGSATHTHTVQISQADLTSLKNKQAVSRDSTNNSDHMHTVTFTPA